MPIEAPATKPPKSPRLPRLPSAWTAFIHDVIMAALSFVIALALRLGDRLAETFNDNLLLALVLFTLVCAGVFWFTGLYRGIWRYASLDDMIAIARAVTLAILLFLPLTFMLTRLDAMPRSMLRTFILVDVLNRNMDGITKSDKE